MAVVAGQIDADLLHIAHDTALTAKIMAKRQAEMERRTKLLNPRTRQLGANHSELESQIMEKRALQDREREDYVSHARAAATQEQVAQALETMHAQSVRDRHSAAVRYSLDNLRQEQRREYHLSDPNELKNERVLTHGELDQMGAASCLSLGEDPVEIARVNHEQQLATRQWLQEQTEERWDREIIERETDRQFDREMQFANHVRMMCEETARQQAIEETHVTAAENQIIAGQHRQRKQAQAEKNTQLTANHVSHTMSSDQLKETHAHLIGTNGRLVRTEYRRPTMEEGQQMHDTNALLVLNRRAQAEALKVEDQAAKAAIQQDIEVREAIEWKKKQATIDRRMQSEEFNRNMAATKVCD